MKIKNAKVKGNIFESGYYNIFKNEKLARLIQRIQSTCISNGIELEKIIYDKINYEKYEKIDFEQFVNIIQNSTNNVYIRSLTIKSSEFINFGLKLSGKTKTTIDSIYYSYDTKTLYVGDIKSGMGLDTKKSEKEVESLSLIRSLFLKCIKIDNIIIFLTLFICEDISHSSIKTNRTDYTKFTGKDFCNLIEISYNEIIDILKIDSDDNTDYFLSEIENIKNEIKKK